MKEVEKLLKLNANLKITKIERENGYNILHIESKKKKVRCPICNEFTKSIHDKLKPIKVKDLKIFEEPTILYIIKRRFICYKCKKRFVEELNINCKNESLSKKLKFKIQQDLLNYNLSLKYIAETNNVSENTVRNILKQTMKNHPKYLKHLPRVISMDEFKADTTEGKYAYILNDPIHKKVLDILPNRKKEYLIQYFTYCENRHSVEFVISDMYEPYLLVTNIMFPKSKYVVDPFHYTKYIMEVLDKVRIRYQKKYNTRSREYKMLKNRKNVSLLRKYSNEIDWWTFTKIYKNKHQVSILKWDLRKQIFDISEELKNAYWLKEEFLDIINHSCYENCKKEFLNWIDLCKKSKIPEFEEAAKTIENWLDYICNSFIDKRYSNGFTEGTNNLIKVIKRVGFGYKNFDFFRMRLLYILNNKKIKKRKKSRF